jgi:hypothetical protein
MNEYDTKIAALNNEQTSLERRMEALSGKFCEATVGFLTPWYEAQARNEVKRNAEVTGKLGRDQLAVLKQKVRDLQENVSSVVADLLGKDSLWWHKSHGEQRYSYYGNRPPDAIDKAVRLSAGRLAPILEEFGYLTTDSTDHSVWREWDRTGNRHPHNARHYYPYGMEWSPQMRDIMAEYDKAHSRCLRIVEEIAHLEKQKREKQAEDLWDSV